MGPGMSRSPRVGWRTRQIPTVSTTWPTIVTEAPKRGLMSTICRMRWLPLRGRLPALSCLQHLEQRRRLVEPEHPAELAGRLQRRRAPRLQRHHQIGRQHADPCVGGAVGRGDPAQVQLDVVDRLPGGGEGAAQVEQELLKLAQLPLARRPADRLAAVSRPSRLSALVLGSAP